VLGRFTTTWQGIVKRRHGADALLDAIEQLQGAPLPASILETEILPARIDVYDPADLDAVTAAGEVVWVGVEPLGERDGRVALYLADHLPRLLAPMVRLKPDTTGNRKGRAADTDSGSVRLPLDGARGRQADRDAADLSERESAILDCLRARGASFFGPLHEAVGGGYPAETVDALWNLVWQGIITNDTFHALRAFTRTRVARRKVKGPRPDGTSFRSRRLAPPSAEGRWALVTTEGARGFPASARGESSELRGLAEAPEARKRQSSVDRSPKRLALQSHTTKWAAALTQQLLARHGVITREAVTAEAFAGGFGIVYPILKGLEDNGRIRRGYFVAGLGATQFAMPGALDLLRSLRDAPDEVEIAVLAATDPANPYGATLKWPASAASATLARQVAADDPAQARAETAAGADRAAQAGRSPTRSVGAMVILVNGALAAYLARGDRQLVTFLPDAEPDRSKVGRAVARVLIDRARTGGEAPRGMLIEEIDGTPSWRHPIAPFLVEAGFVAGAMGFQATFRRS
jgi:ATP-dependent Lhr-like helicase